MSAYPVYVDAICADFEQLDKWMRELPPPQTDVERAVMRRIRKRHVETAATELRKEAPDVAQSVEKILDDIERMIRRGQR